MCMCQSQVIMTSAQVVETLVTVTDNSPFQDYLTVDVYTIWSSFFMFSAKWCDTTEFEFQETTNAHFNR